MLDWPNYRKYLNEHGYYYDSPGCYVRQAEDGEEEFHPHDFDAAAGTVRWRALADQGLLPDGTPVNGAGTAVLEQPCKPLEADIQVCCPTCQRRQYVRVWAAGKPVGGRSHKCEWCRAVVAPGAWKPV